VAVLLATINSGPFKFFLVLHLLAAIVGFGGVFLEGILGAESERRKGREGLAIHEAALKLGTVAEYVIWTVPVWGIIMLFLSKTGGQHVYWFDQSWVSTALVLYIIGVGVATGVHIPNLRKMRDLMAELNAMGPPPATAPGPGAAAAGPPPQAVELEERGKRAAMLGTSLDLLVIVIVVLMVWKPGL
jgi:hypothetical protein